MLSGRTKAGRLMVALALSLVVVLAAGPGQAAAPAVGVSTADTLNLNLDADTTAVLNSVIGQHARWAGDADGQVVDMVVRLPDLIATPLANLGVGCDTAAMGGIALVNALGKASICDKLITSNAAADWDLGTRGGPGVAPNCAGFGGAPGFCSGGGFGEIANSKGTIAGVVERLVKLPRASASKFGDKDKSELLRVDGPGIGVGVGEVQASTDKLASASQAIDSDGFSRVLNVKVVLDGLLDLLPASTRATVDNAVDQLLVVLNGKPGGGSGSIVDKGVIPQLNDAITAVDKALKLSDTTKLDLTIPPITRDNLITKPLVALRVLESTSTIEDGTGALAGYKVATAESVIKDLDLFGGLIHIDVLIAKASVAANGKPGGTKVLPPVQKAIGIKLFNNQIDIGDFTTLDGISINGQRIDLSAAPVVGSLAATVEGLYEELMKHVLGITVTIPKPTSTDLETKVSGTNLANSMILAANSELSKQGSPLLTAAQESKIEAFAKAQAARLVDQAVTSQVTAMQLEVAPLRKPVLGVDLSAVGKLLPALNFTFSTARASIQNGPENTFAVTATTGVPTQALTLIGMALLMAAVLGRRFILSR